ncbi:MAG TPA: hypothetical protein VFO25_10110 [Candidatus Eremiobacteraceae bacterium]|nr:hypothetical protein [Candidatus Eremiobacteraceae bacterium]
MPERVTRAVRVAVFALCFVFASGHSANACPVSRGAALVLVSQELDPDVFLWDSADRLVRYASGDYDVQTVLKHTVLVHAFSKAFALGCRKQVIRPSASGDPSGASTIYLIGVRVVSGDARGKYGWVLSADIRGPSGRRLTSQRRP